MIEENTPQPSFQVLPPPDNSLQPGNDKKIYTFNGNPGIQLPSAGRLVSDFAHELGKIISGKDIYRRKNIVFTITDNGIGEFELTEAKPQWFRTWIEKYVSPYKALNGDPKKPVFNRTMTHDQAEAVLDSPQFLEQLREIKRLNPCPMPWMRENGIIEMLPEGFDEESQTLTMSPGFQIEPMPGGIEEAREYLDKLLSEFPYAKDEGRSKAVHVSAMLTVYGSGIMPREATKPVFFFMANAEGSGKTTAAKICGAPYKSFPVQALSSNRDEMEKLLLSVTKSGRRLILFDNVKGKLNNPALEAYTTSPYFNGRILGKSEEFSGEAGAVILITGNGLTYSGDMRRRSLVVDFFMPELKAEDRVFKRDLTPDTISKERKKMLSALYTLIFEWVKAGMPRSNSKVHSSFPEWCNSIGAIVEYAGYACPTLESEKEDRGDTDTRDIRKLCELMEVERKYEFSEIVELCERNELFERFTSDRDGEGNLSGRAKSKFGKLLKNYNKREITASCTFEIEGNNRAKRYSIYTA